MDGPRSVFLYCNGEALPRSRQPQPGQTLTMKGALYLQLQPSDLLDNIPSKPPTLGLETSGGCHQQEGIGKFMKVG